ncbi:hypothetical protein C8F04DRAFT_221865 [Mycena alexandri]|uniref:Uncharacterized protein n=1 Tax=Mycena alexandri TaxID=1745969 RepID=A0AAD6TKU0_9AGAR|nr:hypothetical protein C8F04DRAFT_221865 [Mycena alexandri]
MLAEGSGSRLSDADWYDPEESQQDLEHPKYWSEEDEEVIVGIKQRDTTPMKLETLCGSYRWFYAFPEPGVSEPQNLDVLYLPGTNSTRNQDNPGYLTIGCPSGKQPTLKNITGTVVHFGKEGRFSGIKRAKDRENKNLVNNHWEFVSFKWKENYGDNQDDGNSILALEVTDDTGEPFIMFRCAQSPPLKLGYMWYLDIAARKERRLNSTRNDSGLSHAEMARLGMQAHYPEIRAAAQATVKSKEESESESSSDDEVENPRSAGKRKLDPMGEESVRPKKRKPTA